MKTSRATLIGLLIAISVNGAILAFAEPDVNISAYPRFALSSGLPSSLVQCDKTVVVSSVTAATTQLIALQAGQQIYVCGYSLTIQGVATTPASIKFVQGTGSNCATSPTDLSAAFTGSTVAGSSISVNAGGGLGTVFRTNAGSALCMTTATTTLKAGHLFYTQF